MLRRPNRPLAALIASLGPLACVAGCQLHVLENGLSGKPQPGAQVPESENPQTPGVNPWFSTEEKTAMLGGLVAAGYGIFNHFSRARVAKQVKGKG